MFPPTNKLPEEVMAVLALRTCVLTFGVVKNWLTNNEKVDSLFEESINKLTKAGIKTVGIELKPPSEEDQNDDITGYVGEVLALIRGEDDEVFLDEMED